MKAQRGLTSMIAALALAACGYPDFVFNGSTGTGGQGATASATTGAGGRTTASTTTTSTTSTTSTSTTSATSTTGAGGQAATTGTGGGPPVCPVDHLLISQVRSRGLAGASDEFVDLFNPTDEDVLLDASWTLQGRKASLSELTYTVRWTGKSQTIPAHGHYLIAGSAYTQAPAPDDQLSDGITDAASVVLQDGSTDVDALCYYNDFISEGELESLGYTCAGDPISNPHDDTDGTDQDISLDRNAAHGVPECEDTGHSTADFSPLAPSTPESSSSPPAP